MGFDFGCTKKFNDGYGEFFGGVSCGTAFYLTRMPLAPSAGYENAIHRTDSAKLPNINHGGTEYRCTFVSGSQPGVGCGLTDMPDPHGYMFFLTNWIPVGSSLDDPLVIPRAGLARVKLQNISDTDYLADSQNNEFTLTHSFLINDSAGNPEYWDDEKKLCHYYAQQAIADGGARRKTCTGPCHFAWFEQMQPTQEQHKLTFWETNSSNSLTANPAVTAVDATVKTWTNPEIEDSDHGWLVGNFDMYHFPIGIEFAKRSESEGPESETNYVSPERGHIVILERHGVVGLTSVSIDTSGDGIHQERHARNNNFGISITGSDQAGYASALGPYGSITAIYSEFDSNRDDPSEDDPGTPTIREDITWTPVTYENARFYSVDFGAMPTGGYRPSDDTATGATRVTAANPDPVFGDAIARHFGAHYVSVVVARGLDVYGPSGQWMQGNAYALDVFDGDWKSHGGYSITPNPGDGGALPPYYRGESMGVINSTSFAAYLKRNPDEEGVGAGSSDPYLSINRNDTITDKWTIATQGGISRVCPTIYPDAFNDAYSNQRSLLRRAGDNNYDTNTANDDPGVFTDDHTFSKVQLISQGIDPAGGFTVVEYVPMNGWESPGNGVGGRFTVQNYEFPLTASDYTLAGGDADSLSDQGFTGTPAAPGPWNDNFPFYTSGATRTFRHTDCFMRGIEKLATMTNMTAPTGTLPGDGVSSHLSDTKAAYAPRGTWRDISGTYYYNAILSAGGPWVEDKVR